MPVRQNIIAYGLNRSTGRGHAATCMIGQQENHHDYVELLFKRATRAIKVDDSAEFDKEIEQSILLFIHGLTNIPNHLPPHMRKWYYIVSNALSVPRRQSELNRLLDTVRTNSIIGSSKRFATFINLQHAVVQQLQIGDNNVAQIQSKEKEDE